MDGPAGVDSRNLGAVVDIGLRCAGGEHRTGKEDNKYSSMYGFPFSSCLTVSSCKSSSTSTESVKHRRFGLRSPNPSCSNSADLCSSSTSCWSVSIDTCWSSGAPSKDTSMTSNSLCVDFAPGVRYRDAAGVERGGTCDELGRGVEEKLKRGAALNCWAIGRGVCSCDGRGCRGARSFLITNRCGDGVCGSVSVGDDLEDYATHHRRRRHCLPFMSCAFNVVVRGVDYADWQSSSS